MRVDERGGGAGGGAPVPGVLSQDYVDPPERNRDKRNREREREREEGTEGLCHSDRRRSDAQSLITRTELIRLSNHPVGRVWAASLLNLNEAHALWIQIIIIILSGGDDDDGDDVVTHRPIFERASERASERRVIPLSL